jgi:hypothetical protein
MPAGPKVPKKVTIPLCCNPDVAILFQRHVILAPFTPPLADPMPAGPLHDPVIVFPDWRKTQTGAMVSTNGFPMAPLMDHAPA